MRVPAGRKKISTDSFFTSYPMNEEAASTALTPKWREAEFLAEEKVDKFNRRVTMIDKYHKWVIYRINSDYLSPLMPLDENQHAIILLGNNNINSIQVYESVALQGSRAPYTFQRLESKMQTAKNRSIYFGWSKEKLKFVVLGKNGQEDTHELSKDELHKLVGESEGDKMLEGDLPGSKSSQKLFMYLWQQGIIYFSFAAPVDMLDLFLKNKSDKEILSVINSAESGKIPIEQGVTSSKVIELFCQNFQLPT